MELMIRLQNWQKNERLEERCIWEEMSGEIFSKYNQKFLWQRNKLEA